MPSPEQIMQILLTNKLLMLILIAWILTLKGIALWMSAKRDQKYWFLAILVLNTLGALEIFYILWTRYKENKAEIKQIENEESSSEKQQDEKSAF